MGVQTFNGVGTPNNSLNGYSEGYVYTGGIGLPSNCRLAADGTRPWRMQRIKAFISGRGASRQARIGLGGNYTGWFGVGASSSAQDTGWKNKSDIWGNGGGTATVRLEFDGSCYFGRGGGGTTVSPYGNFDGTIAGSFEYDEVPSAPSTPSLSPGVGSLAIDWAAPSTDGGTAINGYQVQLATNSSFSAGLITVNVGTSTAYTRTGLTPGTRYYVRVAAKNAVTDDASTTSVWSGTANALLGTVPNAPGSVAASATWGAASVSWAAPSSDGGVALSRYEVDYSTDSSFGSGVTTVNLSTSARNYTVVGPTPGTTVYFRVRAVNSIGDSANSSTASATPNSRGVLDVVQGASIVVDGHQVELRTDGAFPGTVTLGVIPFGQTTFNTIQVHGGFATPGGPRNIALTADAAGNLYVVGRQNGTEATVLIAKHVRTGATSWEGSGLNIGTQALPSTGTALADFAAAYVPGVGGSPTGTIVVLARRAGSVGVGALSYAIVNPNSIGGGTLFMSSGSDPSWLPSPPSSAALNTGALDIAPLVAGGTRLAVLGNGWAVIDVVNGTVTSVSKAAAGSSVAARWARILGVNASTFVTLVPTSGSLVISFYNTSGAYLSGYTASGSTVRDGAYGRQWDAYYDTVSNAVRVYRINAGDPQQLELFTVAASTYQASAATAVTTTFGEAGTGNPEIRAPRGRVDERRVGIVGANNGGTGGLVNVIAFDTSGNKAPNAPALQDVVGFDATQAYRFGWSFSDPNPGDETQLAYEWEVEPVAGGGATSSGKITSSAEFTDYVPGTLANDTDYRWRVRTWDELDTAGAWSAYDTFTTSSLGTLTITQPAADNPPDYELSSVDLAWSYAQASDYTQVQRRVRTLRHSDGVVLSDTGMVATTQQTYTVENLPSDVEVRLEVSIVTTAPSAPTVTATRLITPIYGQPMPPELIIEVGTNYVELTVVNPTPTGDRPEVDTNVIERRTTGSGNDFRVIGQVGYAGVYRDLTVRSGRTYDYRVRGVTA